MAGLESLDGRRTELSFKGTRGEVPIYGILNINEEHKLQEALKIALMSLTPDQIDLKVREFLREKDSWGVITAFGRITWDTICEEFNRLPYALGVDDDYTLNEAELGMPLMLEVADLSYRGLIKFDKEWLAANRNFDLPLNSVELMQLEDGSKASKYCSAKSFSRVLLLRAAPILDGIYKDFPDRPAWEDPRKMD